MSDRKVWTFFYGSYINFDVLKEVDLRPERFEVARLNGFDIKIRPLANLVRCESACVYGILAAATHDELNRLYAHAENVLGGVYSPEAVLTINHEDKYKPALCYIATVLDDRPAENDYIDRIVGPAKEYDFPPWYVSHLESFRPDRNDGS